MRKIRERAGEGGGRRKVRVKERSAIEKCKSINKRAAC
jgi:hypothetical protein